MVQRSIKYIPVEEDSDNYTIDMNSDDLYNASYENYVMNDDDDNDCESSSCEFHGWRTSYHGRSIRSHDDMSGQVSFLYIIFS